MKEWQRVGRGEKKMSMASCWHALPGTCLQHWQLYQPISVYVCMCVCVCVMFFKAVYQGKKRAF